MTTCRTTRKLRMEYSSLVRDCSRELRFFPPETRAGQSILDLQWHCHPPPDDMQEDSDDFGNKVLRLHHRSIAKSLEFEMTLCTTQEQNTAVAPETGLPPVGLGAFLLPSSLCNFTSEIEDAARELKGANLSEICDFVFRFLEYAPGATNLQTSASQSLQSRRGVCQDFAHMMIAICRELKMPARYISGHLPGEGAAHAWCEVLHEGQWHAFDPTHNRAVREDYVFIASGRDFRDVAPITGTYRGSAHAQLSSFCKTVVVSR